MISDGTDPEIAVDEQMLRQINDEETIRQYAKAAVEQSPKAVSDYKKGKKAAGSAVVGRAMANSGGRLNPVKLKEICTLLLEEDRDDDVL